MKNFKALYVNKFDNDFTIDNITTAIATRAYKPCTAMQAQSSGFSAVLGDDLTRTVGELIAFAFTKEVKSIPASALRVMLKERITADEQLLGVKLSKKRKAELSADLQVELLPRALPKLTYVQGYIDLTNKLIALDTTSNTLAEDIISTLRKATGSLLSYPLISTNANDELINLQAVLTRWLSDDKALPDCFTYGENVKLESQVGESVVIKNYAIAAPEVRSYLDLGLLVTELGLVYNDSIAFGISVNQNLSKLLSLLVTEPDPDADELSAEEQFDSDLILIAAQHRELFSALTDKIA
jgi:recombination associated protein RdgC